MSYCRQEGKDKIIFASEEYLSQPSSAILLPDDPSEIDPSNAGAILPNGEINWDCPCLGNLPNGPCGPSFREAFSCWVENKDNEQGFAENCFENFTNWERCLSEHKDIYRQGDDPPSSQKNAEAEVPDDIDNFEDDSKIKNNQLTSSSASQSVSVNETRAIAAASTAPKT